MTVLKGAAASALYGSEAANGVILITTKSGKTGQMPSMMLSVTNNSVSLNRVIGMNGTQPQLQLVKILDNPVEFINMTLGAYFAFENHRTPLF